MWRWIGFMKIYGKVINRMFKFLSTKEQLLEEKRKNEALQAIVKDLEDALIEVAEIAAENAEVIDNG